MSIFGRRTQFAGSGAGNLTPPDTQSPTTPSNLVATVQSDTSIKLTWSASTDNVGVDHYNIYNGGVNIAISASTTYTNTGLTAGTAYSYSVTAVDAATNESAHSNTASATTSNTGGGATHDLLFGARIAPFTVAPYNTYSGVSGAIGTLQLGRVYHDSGLPANWSSTLADSGMSGFPSDAGCIISTKVANSNYASYIASIPDALLNAGKIYMTFHHEPEGDYANGAAFVSDYTTFYNAIKAIETRIKIGPIAEGDKYGRYPDSEAVAGNYLPDASICDFYGLDLYHPMNGNSISGGTYDPETVIELTDFQDWKAWYTAHVQGRGKPVMIAEWGMYAEPDQYNTGAPNTTDEATKQANRAIMISKWIESLRELPETCEGVVYWYVDGKSTENGTFRPSDTASNNALTAIARAGT